MPNVVCNATLAITGEDRGPRRCVPAVDGAWRPAADSPAGGAAGLAAGRFAAGCGATSSAPWRAAGRPGSGHARCNAVRLLHRATHVHREVVLAAARDAKHLPYHHWGSCSLELAYMILCGAIRYAMCNTCQHLYKGASRLSRCTTTAGQHWRMGRRWPSQSGRMSRAVCLSQRHQVGTLSGILHHGPQRLMSAQLQLDSCSGTAKSLCTTQVTDLEQFLRGTCHIGIQEHDPISGFRHVINARLHRRCAGCAADATGEPGGGGSPCAGPRSDCGAAAGAVLCLPHPSLVLAAL